MRGLKALLLTLLLALPCSAQLGGGEPDLDNLGVLGLGIQVSEQEIGGQRLVVLTVGKVDEGGPAARAGIQTGDRIVQVGGEMLDVRQPIAHVIANIERAEAKKKTPVILGLLRAGELEQVEVEVEQLGSHSSRCPAKCKKCREIVRRGLEFLAANQEADGCFPTSLGGKTGKVVVTSLAGLAFLAAGIEPEPGNPVARAADFVMRHCGVAENSPFGGMGGGGNWNQENWELGYGLMFLSEIAKRTGGKDVLAKCAEIAAKILDNQEQSGGWAHGPGGPNALGYLELEIVGNYCLLGLGCARRLGLEIDAEKVALGLTWIEGTSSGDGGVGYSHRQGQQGVGEAGRTAGAILAFAALGQERHPFFQRMVNYFQRELDTLTACHVSPAQHLLAGAMASRLLGKKSWQHYMDTYRLHIMAARRPDGSFTATPNEETRLLNSNTDRDVGANWLTATYVLILSLDEGELEVVFED